MKMIVGDGELFMLSPFYFSLEALYCRLHKSTVIRNKAYIVLNMFDRRGCACAGDEDVWGMVT